MAIQHRHDFRSMTILELMLKCAAFPDRNVAVLTFNFWYDCGDMLFREAFRDNDEVCVHPPIYGAMLSFPLWRLAWHWIHNHATSILNKHFCVSFLLHLLRVLVFPLRFTLSSICLAWKQIPDRAQLDVIAPYYLRFLECMIFHLQCPGV